MISFERPLLALCFSVAATLAGAGCASIPPPHVLDEADAVAQSPSALDAKQFAPSAFAAAEKLRTEAHAALKDDRIAHVQILAEQSIAAYEEAAALARVAHAEHSEEETNGRVAGSQKELDELTAQLDAVQADVDGLELQLKVARDAETVVPSGPASAEREAARKSSAHAMLVQSKLLCASARIISPAVASGSAPAGAPTDASDPTSIASIHADLTASEASIEKLSTELDGKGPTPIDLATRTRASCLSVLQRSRRSSTKTVGATSAETDSLVGELSAMAARFGGNLSPQSDERGVSITLHSAFDGDKVADAIKARIADLDRVAAAHPKFAVAIVLHSDVPVKDADQAHWSHRADALASLFSVPRENVFTLLAGNFTPIVDPHGKNKSDNARVEIIFVPRSL